MVESRECSLITGATSGIGQAIAIELSRTHNLIVHGRDAERLRSTLSKCARPDSHYIWVCDLADDAQITDGFRGFLQQHQLLVRNFIHCAGVVRVAPLRQVAAEEMLRTFSVNLFSAIAIIQAILQLDANLAVLRNLLFISSAASLRGEKGVAIYSATKGAVDALAKSLATELAPAVRVNAILPGLVRTPMSEATIRSADFQHLVKRKYPLGVGEVQDIADAVSFLISDMARWITGALWVIDGGRTAT